MNIAIITLDSLRYDTTNRIELPYLGNLGVWYKAYTQATDTYLAHSAIFKYGHFPLVIDNDAPDYLRYKITRKYLFRAILNWDKNYTVLYPTPEASNIIKGFKAKGYRTIGIGGVSWFDNTFLTSQHWTDYFEEFYWQPEFSQDTVDSFKHQIDFTVTKIKDIKESLLLFVNVSVTHNPSWMVRYRIGEQVQALEYVDKHMHKLIDAIPKPCHIIICGDHGSVMKEDNYFIEGHGFYHPKVMEVPLMEIKL